MTRIGWSELHARRHRRTESVRVSSPRVDHVVGAVRERLVEAAALDAVAALDGLSLDERQLLARMESSC